MFIPPHIPIATATDKRILTLTGVGLSPKIGRKKIIPDTLTSTRVNINTFSTLRVDIMIYNLVNI